MQATSFFSVHTRIPPREIREHEAARQILKGHDLTLLEAVKFAQDHYQPVVKVSPQAIIETYAKHRKSKGISESQISNVTKAARRLDRWLNGKPLHWLSETKFEHFMDSVFDKPVKPKTYNGFLGDIRTFLKWARAKHYLATDPTIQVEEQKLVDSVPTTLKPDAAEAFMHTVEIQHPGWIPYAAFCLFAAIRPSIREGEALRLDRMLRKGKVDFTAEGFDVLGKAHGIRTVPWVLCGPLKQWLNVYPIAKGQGLWPEATPPQAERKWANVRSACNLEQDVLRHTGISAMCYSPGASLAQVAIASGTSESMIRKRYLGRWTTAHTHSLWSILPSRTEKAATLAGCATLRE